MQSSCKRHTNNKRNNRIHKRSKNITINEKPLTNLMHLEENCLKIKVTNEGQAAAFFKLAVRQHRPSSQQHQFVLNKGQERRLKMTLSEKVTNLAFFHGPEVARQMYKLANSAKEDNNSEFLLGEDFKCHFDGEKPLQHGFKDTSKHFFNTIQRNLVQIESSMLQSIIMKIGSNNRSPPTIHTSKSAI